MKYVTAKELREKLALIPDDTKIAIKQKTNDGDSLYLDLKYENVKDKFMDGIFYLHSPVLDFIIEGEKEQIKEETTLW